MPITKSRVGHKSSRFSTPGLVSISKKKKSLAYFRWKVTTTTTCTAFAKSRVGAHIGNKKKCQGTDVRECVAGSLSPEDYDLFALPYQKMVVKAIKDKAQKTNPEKDSFCTAFS
jgi:hypothetical protein